MQSPIESLAWSPDGRSLAFERNLATSAPHSRRIRLHVLDVPGDTVRELPVDAINRGSIAWSGDGTALFRIAFDFTTGTPMVEVVSVASGLSVRRIANATWLGSVDGVRQLIAADGALLGVRSLEAPRVLFADPTGQPYDFIVAPSPDGSRLSILETTVARGAVLSVRLDGSDQRVLGLANDFRSCRASSAPTA